MHKKTRQPEELEPLPDLHKCKGTHTADFSSAPQGQYTRFFPFSQAHLLSRNRIATCWFSGTSVFCLLSVRLFLCLFHTVRRVFLLFLVFRRGKKMFVCAVCFLFPVFSIFKYSKKFFFSLSRKKSGGSFRTREKHPPLHFLFLSLFGKTEKNTAARKSWNLFRSLRR